MNISLDDSSDNYADEWEADEDLASSDQDVLNSEQDDNNDSRVHSEDTQEATNKTRERNEARDKSGQDETDADRELPSCSLVMTLLL